MQCVSARIHTSKLNIFSQTIKVSDCFLQYSVFIWQNYTFKMPTLVRMKFILSQTHTALAGSRLYFHQSRSNPFVDANDNALCRRMARSTAPRPAYRGDNWLAREDTNNFPPLPISDARKWIYSLFFIISGM